MRKRNFKSSNSQSTIVVKSFASDEPKFVVSLDKFWQTFVGEESKFEKFGEDILWKTFHNSNISQLPITNAKSFRKVQKANLFRTKFQTSLSRPKFSGKFVDDDHRESFKLFAKENLYTNQSLKFRILSAELRETFAILILFYTADDDCEKFEPTNLFRTNKLSNF